MKNFEKNSYKTGKKCCLSELGLNQKGKIISVFHPNFSLRMRLLDMGLTKNVIVTITKLSPFGNPMSIMFRNYELVMRKQDLKNIMVEVIK